MMKKKPKVTKVAAQNLNKETVQIFYSSDNMKSVWVFDKLDKNGLFAFDLRREDFNHKEFLEKMISYSNMTWREILAQTHDMNKSKHHRLEYESLSAEAQERIRVLELEQDTDRIYSFALQNRLRIIGLRENEKFHVIWYDPDHRFCPSKRK